jgi:hypothetical protein
MENEWIKIKAVNSSQDSAFEELVCQLAFTEKRNDYTNFERVGTPDGGLECYWTKKDGTEVGWQAKYFQALNSGEWSSIKKSLLDAVETHPKLTEYIICLPHNLSDGRRGKKTQKLVWGENKEKWEEEIKSKGRSVTLALWNSSTLISLLTKKENQGIKQYFFNEIVIDEDKLNIQLNASIKNLGPKYCKDLNFKLDYIPTVFDALSRNKRFEIAFKKNIDSYLKKLNAVLNDSSKKELIKDEASSLNESCEKFKKIVGEICYLPSESLPIIELLKIVNSIYTTADKILAVYEQENEIEKKEHRIKVEKGEIKEVYNSFRGKNEYPISHIHEYLRENRSLKEYFESELISAANKGVLFLSGQPGVGKSHLIADIVTERQKDGIPSLLFLGEFFPENEPSIHLQQKLNPLGSLESYLGALESLAKIKESRILFVIDAINEGKGKYFWKNYLKGFVDTLKQYKWIGFVFTYRTTFKNVLIPEDFEEPTIEHTGFEGFEYEATKEFFKFYKIEQPKIPILNPEFSNPLFLKTFCLTLFKAGHTSIPEGYEGISAILNAYIESVNKILGEKLNYPYERINLVKNVIEKIINYQTEINNKVIPWKVGYKIADEEISIYSNSKGFIEELIKEGIFIEDYFYDLDTDKHDTNGISFCYERFNEHLRALLLISNIENETQLKNEFNNDGKLLQSLTGKYKFYSGLEDGLLNALSIVIPEKFGIELHQVLTPEEQHFKVSIFESFLYSLVWRRASSIKIATRDYINKFLGNEHWLQEFLKTLCLVTANPSHPYNADYLHNILITKSIAERDFIWSIPVAKIWSYDTNNIIRRIIDWGWNYEDKSHYDEKSIYLFGKLLAWLFTNSDRKIRDKATKAFSCVFIDKTHLLLELLNEFKDVNDPYVIERILAGILGAVSHSQNKESNREVAQYIYDLYFANKNPPVNVLSRDYAKGVIEYVSNSGVELKFIKDNIYPPFNTTFPTKFPSEKWVKTKDNLEKIKGEYTYEQRGQLRVTHSVLSWDFARYILGTDHSNSFPFSYYTLESKNGYEVLKKKLKGGCKKMFTNFVDSTTMLNGTSELGKSIKKIASSEQKEEILKETQKFVLVFKKELEKMLPIEERKLFETAQGYIETGFETDNYNKKRFDVKLVQRYILKKVFDLGWTMEKFGAYDARLDDYSRDAGKAERVGKKYQWIAYYEIMALLSDHFSFLERFSDEEQKYKGSWQHHFRNIDPSSLNRYNPIESDYEDKFKNWWLTENYSNWDEPNGTWLNRMDDLPNIAKLINLKCNNNIDWYLLYDIIDWKQQAPIGEDRYNFKRKDLWINIQAFLVTKTVKEKLLKFADKKLFWLRENYPELMHYYEAFNCELYNSDAYTDIIDGSFTKKPYKEISVDRSINKAIHTVEDSGFSDGYDMSQEKVNVHKPSEYLFNMVNAKFGKNDACIYNQEDEVIGFDTGLMNNLSERAFVIKKQELDEALAKNGLEIVWMFCGEKEDIGERVSYVYRMLYSGIGYLDKGEFKVKQYHKLEK